MESQNQLINLNGYTFLLALMYRRENGMGILIKNLCSIPGIAFVTAITFYTEIMDIYRFPNIDHFCSYVGLVPSVHSSGDRQIEKGLTTRRNCLYAI